MGIRIASTGIGPTYGMGRAITLAVLLGFTVPGSAAVGHPAPGTSMTVAADQAQLQRCTRHYQRDDTIYFHNNCDRDVWWAACFTFAWGDGEERQGTGLGIPPGQSGNFSPGPGPFTYRILRTFDRNEYLDCFD